MSKAVRDTLWYKDAVIYELHVKTFYDADGSGVGDFSGLIAKLDYLRDLGVSALWLLPFYPSPLRDDGYDVADYRDVHPAYGTLGDFQRFLGAAHERGLRIIIDLVINHTSDQHPWFQRARKEKPGSPLRDFYVWSDTIDTYAGTRIIFSDTETSNWAWDPVAGSYYWHRFFSHQPDLNFANPLVVDEVLEVVRFWLRMGVDGMRLDAIPYLCEREGTNNESLPETHALIKRLRSVIEAEFPECVFLAEANQPPEQVCAYFGAGDECHMAFHFPLMPRMFSALAQEDGGPIIDILERTPSIPPSCQWAIFLRNHDELTLEMLDGSERALLYRVYAADPRARLNVGIRRRLAPLLENDPRKIRLMTALLLSMPGTPVLYYGDEIGMGDDLSLPDRAGLRTPMQWSARANGGFSTAAAERLCSPPIENDAYGYRRVNVENAASDPASLLHYVRKLISVRRANAGLSGDVLTFLPSVNRKMLAYLREEGDSTVLCVFNLASTRQVGSMDLSRFIGSVPLDMLEGASFPVIGLSPYMLALPAHALVWLSFSGII